MKRRTDIPAARLNKPQREFVRGMVAEAAPEQSEQRRLLMAAVRERWFHDLARLYPQAVAAIEAGLAKSAPLPTRLATGKWLMEQRRAMIPEEREAEASAREAADAPGIGKSPSEMTLQELEASVARLSLLAAAETAEDAIIVPESGIFD